MPTEPRKLPTGDQTIDHESDRLQRLARLAVEVGANVQPGQYVIVRGRVEHAPLAREIARAAYRAGAALVETGNSDGHFDRALIELGPEESLAISPPGDLAALKDLTARYGALVSIAGDPAPHLLRDLDPARVGKLIPSDHVSILRNDGFQIP